MQFSIRAKLHFGWSLWDVTLKWSHCVNGKLRAVSRNHASFMIITILGSCLNSCDRVGWKARQ